MEEIPLQKEGSVFLRVDYCRSTSALKDSLISSINKEEEMGKFLADLNNDLHLASNTDKPEIDPDQQTLYNMFFVVITLRQLLVKLIQVVCPIDSR